MLEIMPDGLTAHKALRPSPAPGKLAPPDLPGLRSPTPHLSNEALMNSSPHPAPSRAPDIGDAACRATAAVVSGAFAIHDLAGAAAQRLHAELPPGVPGLAGAMDAERRAQRPKPAKLVADERLREYVQDRLAGNVVHALDGRVVEGPQVAPWQGRNKPPSGPPLGELLGPKVLPGVQGVAGVAERPVHADRVQVDGTSSWSASRSSPHMRATAPDGCWPAEAFSCGGGEILDGRARV